MQRARLAAILLLFGVTLGALAPASAAGPDGEKVESRVPREGYACCNLHYTAYWISAGINGGIFEAAVKKAASYTISHFH